VVEERREVVEGELPMCPAGLEVQPRQSSAGAARSEPEPEPVKSEPTKEDAIEMELE
jgi:hypothetical protein